MAIQTIEQAVTDEDVFAAIMALIAEKGWCRSSLGQVAQSLGIAEQDLRHRFGNKTSILLALIDQADAAMVADLDPALSSEAPKDRLFELMMARLDFLSPYKSAINRLGRDLLFDPPTGLCIAAKVNLSMGKLLEAAGLASKGPLGVVKAKVLTGVYMKVLSHWFKDDSPDSGPTMAELDKLLINCDELASFLSKYCVAKS